MKRLALVITMISLVGCAHGGRPEAASSMSPAQLDNCLHRVLDRCGRLHEMARSGESPVDCAYNGDLSAMHLSFPSVAYHNEHYEMVMLSEHHWCVAAQAKVGHSVSWVRHFRRENHVVARPCHPSTELHDFRRQYEAEKEARQK